MKVYWQYLSGKVYKIELGCQTQRYERFSEKIGRETHFTWSNEA